MHGAEKRNTFWHKEATWHTAVVASSPLTLNASLTHCSPWTRPQSGRTFTGARAITGKVCPLLWVRFKDTCSHMFGVKMQISHSVKATGDDVLQEEISTEQFMTSILSEVTLSVQSLKLSLGSATKIKQGRSVCHFN